MSHSHEHPPQQDELSLYPDAILELDQAGRVTRWNHHATHLFEGLLDTSNKWFSLLHIEDQKQGLDAWSKATTSQGTWHTFQARHADPEVVVGAVLEWRLCVIDADTQLTRCIIRNLQGPFEALSRRKLRLRQLYERTPIMAHSIDARGRLIMVSELWLERLGYAREEVIGRPSTDFLTEESKQLAKQILPEYFEKGACTDVPYQMVTKSGKIIDVELSATAELNDDGSFGRSFAVMIDVTQRNTLIRQLASQNALLEAFFEAIPYATVLVNTQRQIVRANSSVEQTFGYTEEEILGQATQLFYAEETGFQRTGSAIFNQERQAENLNTHVNFRDKEGRLFKGELIGAQLINTRGQVEGYLGLMRDMTQEIEQAQELSQQNKRLVQANKDLERFAYIASHDLQEPLRKISSFITLLKDHLDGSLDETGSLYFGFVQDGASRMQSLIRDLLAYSRADALPDLVPCDPIEILEQSIKQYQPMLDKAGASLTIEDLSEGNKVMSHDSVLSQVYSNLLSNAIKYAHPERTLKLTIKSQVQSDTHISIHVIDNGIGVPARYQNKIFEIFQRLHRQKDIQGQGIGLAICKKIVERQGGEFGMTSDGESGSAFWFTLRRA